MFPSAAQMTRDLQMMVDDFPLSVTVDGLPWSCTADDLTEGGSTDDTLSFVTSPSRSYTGLQSGLSKRPTAASVLVDNGKTYRVVDVSISIDGISMRLDVKGDLR